jgi:hypothetical protein
VSIEPFIGPHDGSFDPETTRLMGEAFDAVCAYLGPSQSPLVYEEAAGRIIDAARRGERDPMMLRAAGLTPRADNVV